MTKTYDVLRQAVKEALPAAEKDEAVAQDVVSALRALGILLNGGGTNRGGGKSPWEIMPGAVSRIDTFESGISARREAAASVALDGDTQSGAALPTPKRGRPRKPKPEAPAITDDLAETVRNGAISASEKGTKSVRVSALAAGFKLDKQVIILALSSDHRFSEKGRGWWTVKA